MQHNHTITTVNRRDGVAIDTGLFVEAFRQGSRMISIYLRRVTGADGVIDMRLVGAVEIDIEVVDAIQRIEGNQSVRIMNGVICQRGSVLLLVSGSPYMRERRVDWRTNVQRVAEDMRLMHGEAQGHGTIATELVRHGVRIFAGNEQRIGMCRVFACTRFAPCVDPNVRQLTVGHCDALRRNDDAVTQLQTQLDDTVATIKRGQSVVIDTRIMEVTLFGSVVLAFKEVTVKLNRITVAKGIDNLRVV